MSDWIEFSNEGEVPINAFKLLGASSKRNDSTKIGYFGTGLKYALAVLLREGVDFKVFSGNKEVSIGTRKTKFLDQVVTVITVNGEKTSITIEAGIDWELWFAIREIYSNNLDEAGTMKLVQTIEPTRGFTKIYIKQDEKLRDLTDNWSSYFSNTRAVISGDDEYKVLQKNNKKNLTVFRRGIKAYSNRTESVFDYDINKLKINESRVATHDFEARQRCAEALALCTSTDALQHFLHANMEVIEKQPEFWDYLFDESLGQFSNAWFEVLKDKRIVPTEYGGFYGMTAGSVALPEKLCKHLYLQFGDRLQIMGATKEAYMIVSDDVEFLEPAMQKLATIDFDHPMDKVKLARFKDEGILGCVDGDMILISEKVKAPLYRDDILHILFEEVAHARSGHSDNTRAFQDYIIKMACGLIPDNG